jgi:hypothetical protein
MEKDKIQIIRYSFFETIITKVDITLPGTKIIINKRFAPGTFVIEGDGILPVIS